MFRNIRNTSRFRHNARPISKETLYSHFRAILRPRRRRFSEGRHFVRRRNFPLRDVPTTIHSVHSHPGHISPCIVSRRRAYVHRTRSRRRPCDRNSTVKSASRPVRETRPRFRDVDKGELLISFFLSFFVFVLGAVHLRRSPHLIPSSEAVSIHPQLDPHLVSVIIKKATKNFLITVLINDVKKDQRKANKNQACYRHDSLAIKIEPYKFATMHFTLGFGGYNAGRENRKLGEEPRRNPPWLGRGAAE